MIRISIMNKIWIIIFLFMWTTFSCVDNKISNEISVIDIASNVFNLEKVYLSDFASKINYIPLENNIDFPIGGVVTRAYIDFSDDYIIDSDGMRCILYNSKGVFIRPIGRIGRGPGEYGGVTNVFIRGNKIFVHDYLNDDLLEYSVDGSFIDRHDSGFKPKGILMVDYRNAYLLNDSLIMLNIDNISGKEENKAYLFNMEGTIVKAYRNYIFYNFEQSDPYGWPVYHTFEGNLYFKEVRNDTLFMLDKSYRMLPIYVFNLGKYGVPLNEPVTRNPSYITVDGIFQTGKYIFLDCYYGDYFTAKRFTPRYVTLPNGVVTYWTNSNNILGLYEKTTGQLVFSEPTDGDNPLYSSGIYNDIDAGPRFMPSKMVNDSTMAMGISFNQLVSHVESDDFKNNTPKNPEQKDKLAAMVDSLKKADFDNPVYMLVTFKN